MKIMDSLFSTLIYSLKLHSNYVFEEFIDYQQIMILWLLLYK